MAGPEPQTSRRLRGSGIKWQVPNHKHATADAAPELFCDSFRSRYVGGGGMFVDKRINIFPELRRSGMFVENSGKMTKIPEHYGFI